MLDFTGWYADSSMILNGSGINPIMNKYIQWNTLLSWLGYIYHIYLAKTTETNSNKKTLQKMWKIQKIKVMQKIGLYHQNGIHWKWMDDTAFVYANLLGLYSWINRKLNGFGDAIMLRLSDKYLLDDIASELCTNVNNFVAFNGDIIFKDCKSVSVDNNGRNEAVVIDKQYVNKDRIVLIDYIFQIWR